MATQAPPAYGTSDAPKTSKDPLLQYNSQHAQGNTSPHAHFADEDEIESIEEDFKIGVTVAQSSQDVRNAFIRKVYGMLFTMLSATIVVGAVMRVNSVQSWMQENVWFMWTSIIGTFASLFACMWKRHSHPANLVCLSAFTVFEAVTVGTAVSYYDQVIVLKAVVLTAFIFLGLTLFTFQSKFDFSTLGPWLFTGLMTMLGVGLIGLFFPWSNTFDIIYSVIGVLIFSGYILFDTHALLHRLSPDEWVMAVISLYLDIINLALYIMRLLNDTSSD